MEAIVAGHTVAAQADVKTRHPDGSAWLVLVTLPGLPGPAGADASVLLRDAGAAATTAAEAPTPSGLVVTVSIHGGPQRAIPLDAPTEGTPWLAGPIATERRVTAPVAGSLRLVADIRQDEAGLWADIALRDDAAFDPAAGPVTYDLAVRRGNAELYHHDGIAQGLYTAWRFQIDSHRAPAPHVVHDIAALERMGVVAAYDLAAGVATPTLAREAEAMRDPAWNAPFSNRLITRGMPGTGGRPDIGVTTLPNTVWLITQSETGEAYALGQAEAAGAIPWHFWDTAHDSWASLLSRPTLWIDPRGGHSGAEGIAHWIDPGLGWEIDTAHQPDLSFVPFLLTGRRSTLDELNAQAAWAIASHWPAPEARDNGKGLVVQGNQVRGAAWSLRAIDEAAWANPDGSPEKAYFQQIARNNWEWLIAARPGLTAAQGESAGRLPGSYGDSGAFPPWQQDYLASSVVQAAGFAIPQARDFLAWQAGFLVGRFRQKPDVFNPRDGCAYNLYGRDKAGHPALTWRDAEAATVAAGMSNRDGWAQSQGDYGALALQSLAGVANVLHQPEALAAYAWLKKAAPPYTSRAELQKDPTYAIVPLETRPGVAGP